MDGLKITARILVFAVTAAALGNTFHVLGTGAGVTTTQRFAYLVRITPVILPSTMFAVAVVCIAILLWPVHGTHWGWIVFDVVEGMVALLGLGHMYWPS